MKEYRLRGVLYRIEEDGRVKTKSAYSNVWMLSDYRTEEDLVKAGAKEVNEHGE